MGPGAIKQVARRMPTELAGSQGVRGHHHESCQGTDIVLGGLV